MRDRLPRLLVLATALSLSACSPPWTVIVKSGPPSALAAVQQVTMASDQSQMMIGERTLPAELAARDPNEQAALRSALSAMEAAFASGFAAGAAVPTLPAQTAPLANEARVTVRWAYVDPGKYAFIYKRDSVLRARIIFTIGNAVVDEIEIQRKVDANRSQGSIVERLNIGGDQIGRYAARYFVQARQGQ